MGNITPSVDQAEHIGSDATGDNIQAKRVANYGWDGSNWQRQAASLINTPYDYIGFSPDRDNPTSIVFKSGGSGGTTVATLTLDSTSVTKT